MRAVPCTGTTAGEKVISEYEDVFSKKNDIFVCCQINGLIARWNELDEKVLCCGNFCFCFVLCL